jgi:hypothetical protein
MWPPKCTIIRERARVITPRVDLVNQLLFGLRLSTRGAAHKTCAMQRIPTPVFTAHVIHSHERLYTTLGIAEVLAVFFKRIESNHSISSLRAHARDAMLYTLGT